MTGLFLSKKMAFVMVIALIFFVISSGVIQKRFMDLPLVLHKVALGADSGYDD